MLPYWYSANKPHFQIFIRLHDDVHLREAWTDAQSRKCVCVERKGRERAHALQVGAGTGRTERGVTRQHGFVSREKRPAVCRLDGKFTAEHAYNSPHQPGYSR